MWHSPDMNKSADMTEATKKLKESISTKPPTTDDYKATELFRNNESKPTVVCDHHIPRKVVVFTSREATEGKEVLVQQVSSLDGTAAYKEINEPEHVIFYDSKKDLLPVYDDDGEIRWTDASNYTDGRKGVLLLLTVLFTLIIFGWLALAISAILHLGF